MPKMPIFGDVSLSLILVIVLVALLWMVYTRSVAGYESQMTGFNMRSARYGGIDVEQRTVQVMMVAGAIGGLIGTHLIIGEALRFIDGELVLSGFAWTGLLVSLLAVNRPIPIFVTGMFFSGLQIGGLAMQRNAGVSWRLSQVLQAVVIVAVACRLAIRRTERPSTDVGEAESSAVGEV